MKNIVLLSDGTGNGAAKRKHTNVWRLYRALDSHRDDQVAFYDDGVGAQEFLPLKLLGGAFGWGLKRNVLQLYAFLCRNYEIGDRIYLFGFSRGAFTVRQLAGLVDFCGLMSGCTDQEELQRWARRAYSRYHNEYRRGYLTSGLRALARAKAAVFSGASAGEEGKVLKPPIEFIGVWDTVDAYGLPIDELAILWDMLIYPLRFPNQRLPSCVNKACHALSIDDERLTFHPVLWDEKKPKDLADQKQFAAGREIEQVWFAGAHSDVGGGYPMDDLALVPLDWMMSKVEDRGPGSPGLHFIPELRDQYQCHANWHGMQHDSRAGLAAYYRYKPRNIQELCNDRRNGVTVDEPKIHRAVFDRISRNSVPYAPTGIPAEYKIVTTRHNVPPYEDSETKIKRSVALNGALDVVYWRRWLYSALVSATVLLFASRFFLDWQPGGICKGAACAIDPVLRLAIESLPDFTSGWFEALRQNPRWLTGFVVAFAVFFWLKRVAWRLTQAKATAAWAKLKGYGGPPAWKATLTSWLRQAAQSKLRHVAHWGTAVLVFALIVYLLIAAAGHVSLYVRSTIGLLCKPSEVSASFAPRSVTFDISDPCFATGIRLQKGQRYRIDVNALGWFDGDNPGGPDGLKHPLPVVYTLAAPMRREITERWFRLMGRVGSVGNERLPIGAGPKLYRARSDGELFLYVNDAVFGFLPNWSWPYSWRIGANKGQATVTVSPVEKK